MGCDLRRRGTLEARRDRNDSLEREGMDESGKLVCGQIREVCVSCKQSDCHPIGT